MAPNGTPATDSREPLRVATPIRLTAPVIRPPVVQPQLWDSLALTGYAKPHPGMKRALTKGDFFLQGFSTLPYGTWAFPRVWDLDYAAWYVVNNPEAAAAEMIVLDIEDLPGYGYAWDPDQHSADECRAFVQRVNGLLRALQAARPDCKFPVYANFFRDINSIHAGNPTRDANALPWRRRLARMRQIQEELISPYVCFDMYSVARYFGQNPIIMRENIIEAQKFGKELVILWWPQYWGPEGYDSAMQWVEPAEACSMMNVMASLGVENIVFWGGFDSTVANGYQPRTMASWIASGAYHWTLAPLRCPLLPGANFPANVTLSSPFARAVYQPGT